MKRVLEAGRVCILDIDVQGARSVRKTPLKAIFVFVAPPSLEDLAKRLVGRGTESVEQIKRRLGNAKDEINRHARLWAAILLGGWVAHWTVHCRSIALCLAASCCVACVQPE